MAKGVMKGSCIGELYVTVPREYHSAANKAKKESAQMKTAPLAIPRYEESKPRRKTAKIEGKTGK